MTHTIYLAARYSRHTEMQGYAEQIHALPGYHVRARWILGNHRITDEDIHAGREYALIQQYLQEDINDLTSADTLVAFTEAMRTPTRGGRHVEFGMALALGKRLIVVGGAENLFYHAPAVLHVASFDDVLRFFKANTPYNFRGRLCAT